MAKMDALKPADINKAQPEEKVEKGLKTIGNVPENLRKLWTLMRQTAESGQKVVKKHEALHRAGTDSPEACQKLEGEIKALAKNIEALEKLFWFSLASELGISPFQSIGLRQGWQVVNISPKKASKAPAGQRRNWLKDIQAKMDTLTQKEIHKYTPDVDVQPDDTVIGTVPENLRKLCVLQMIMSDQTQQKVKAHNLLHGTPNHKQEDCAKFHEELQPVKEELSLLKNIFWLCLGEELNLDGGSTGIRAGWNVVTISEQRSNEMQLAQALAGLFGR
jgi:hypothetical protein